MLRSLFSGGSGLRKHQVRMDVIGNSVTDVNTVAFKEDRVTFKEGFTQLLQGASRPPGDQGGVDPTQIGLAMQIGSVDTLFTQRNVETTGLDTDLAIQGDSFFVVRNGDQRFYTRSGNFQLDADGRLVSPTNGFVVQGRIAVAGKFVDGVQDIRLPFDLKAAAKPTRTRELAGNLAGSAGVMLGPVTDPTTAPPTRAAVDPLDAAHRALPKNGYTAGTLESFSIDRTGTITGSFTDGTTEPVGQIVLAAFSNPSGLLRTGDNVYAVSGNSGAAVLGYAREGSRSKLTSGALEVANVDFAL
jgi:flagellar hook protein FlgE